MASYLSKLGDSLIGSAGSFLSTITGGLIGAASASSQTEMTKELMKYQHDLNSIGDFVKQAQESGFNPASLYGNSSPSLSTSLGSPPDVASSIIQGASTGMNQSLIGSQVRNIEADTDLKKAQAGYTQLQAAAEKLRNDYLPKFLDQEMTLNDYENALKYETIGFTKDQRKLILANTEKCKAETVNLQEQFKLYQEQIRKAKNEADIAEITKNFTPELLNKQLQEVNSRIRLNSAQADQVIATIANINADTNLKDVQTSIQRIARAWAEDHEKAKYGIEQQKWLQEDYKARRMAAGQETAEYMSDVAEFLAALGSVVGGFVRK